jgi:iron complex outermembrane receptor protein
LGIALNSCRHSRLAAASIALAAAALGGDAALAQTSNSGATSQPLPSVVVTSPQRRAAAPAAQRSRRPTAQSATASRRPKPPSAAAAVVENPRGAFQGYVAGRSMAGTKTNTPIMQTPQSLSVIGSEQIRDQKPGKFDEILRYTPGVVAGTFGADTRNDWFLIRGFKSDDIGLFLDGLQLFYTSYASWKLPPFNLARVEVLRGPSAVLYGGSSPSGIVNAVSKMPPTEPIRYIEAGVNNFGNAYTSFDVGGPVATAPGNGQLFYRVVGQVQNGGTQVDFTPDNNYLIAPSVTYKPDADTTFTVLASASRTDTRGINFLPYVGTVVNAPFGRIPTNLFVGDPSADKFTREQEMLGYQFEKNLTDNLTFRQNARYAHVDLTYRGFIGNNYANVATGDIGRYNWYAKNTANQGNLDNQLEYRVDTGAVQHTMLFGLDLKNYRIDDYQIFAFGTVPSINALNPVYGTGDIPFTGSAPFRNFLLSQNQLGVYLQDQIKFGGFTLVLSGRNDWVSTSQADRPSGATLYNREDSKFSGRAGLIYNFANGLAPYVAYATSYNPIIGLNASNQLFVPETGVQAEVGLKYQPAGFNGHFSVAVFDLKRKRPDDSAGCPARAADPDRRGHLARPGTRGRRQSAAGAEDRRRLHHLLSLQQQGRQSGADRLYPDQRAAAGRLAVGRLHLPGRTTDRLRLRRRRSLHREIFCRHRKHAGGALSGARRSGGALRMAELARRAERHQRRRHDLCRELRVGDVVLLRRSPPRHGQPRL